MSLTAAPPAASGSQPDPSLRLAAGTELLGPYQDSGSTEAPYLLKRPDGALLQVPGLLYAVAAHIDGHRDTDSIAAAVSAQMDREVTAGDVAFLIDAKLAPAGLIDGVTPDQSSGQGQPGLLSLSLRTKVVPERLVNAAAALLRPLFAPPVIVAVLAGLAAVDGWLLAHRSVAQALHEAIATPALLLVVAGLTMLSGAFHELGHATACRYGGAKPGTIGVGLYLLWPAFFNDMTDAYRLDRRSRLRADLGGVYFNAVFVLAIAALYKFTGFEPLLLAIVIQHLIVVQQFLPFLRLDGYYVVSDLTGVPDLFARIKPILASLVPGRTAAGLADLKPRVRVAVAAWTLITVPVLAACVAMLLIRAPTTLVMGLESFAVHTERLTDAYRDGHTAGTAASALQIAVLMLPVAGVTITGTRLLALTARRWHGAASRLSRLWTKSGEPMPQPPADDSLVNEHADQNQRARDGQRGAVLVGAHPDTLTPALAGSQTERTSTSTSNWTISPTVPTVSAVTWPSTPPHATTPTLVFHNATTIDPR